jgi:hypothetical protein
MRRALISRTWSAVAFAPACGRHLGPSLTSIAAQHIALTTSMKNSPNSTRRALRECIPPLGRRITGTAATLGIKHTMLSETSRGGERDSDRDAGQPGIPWLSS